MTGKLKSYNVRTEVNIKETENKKFNQKTLVDCWAQISVHLPENFNPHYNKFARGYFIAQLRLAQGRPVKARKIFEGLEKKPGYLEFEEENLSLLAAIDIAVKGETNLKVRPLF